MCDRCVKIEKVYSVNEDAEREGLDHKKSTLILEFSDDFGWITEFNPVTKKKRERDWSEREDPVLKLGRKKNARPIPLNAMGILEDELRHFLGIGLGYIEIAFGYGPRREYEEEHA